MSHKWIGTSLIPHFSQQLSFTIVLRVESKSRHLLESICLSNLSNFLPARGSRSAGPLFFLYPIYLSASLCVNLASMCCCCCVAASLFAVLSVFVLVGLGIWIAPYFLSITSGLPHLGSFITVFSLIASVNCSIVISCCVSQGKKKTEIKPEDGIIIGGRPGRPGLCRERWKPPDFT